MIGLSAFVLLGVVAWALFLHNTPGVPGGIPGDPGGAILNQLRPVADALPRDLAIDTGATFYSEPHQDSCDGIPSTVGWDPVEVQIDVKVPSGQELAVLSAVDAYFMTHGWKASSPSDFPDGRWIWPPGSGQDWQATPDWKWAKTLTDGRPAIANFTTLGNTNDWLLQAEAPSTLKPVTGC